jgi:hypothetical protein
MSNWSGEAPKREPNDCWKLQLTDSHGSRINDRSFQAFHGLIFGPVPQHPQFRLHPEIRFILLKFDWKQLNAGNGFL